MIKRPKALQWFHNGRLVKESEEERQAGRFELFLDLLCMLTANKLMGIYTIYTDGNITI